MNKEEKKAIKALQVLSKRIEKVRINSFGLGKEERDILDYVYNPSKAIITVLNLIEKQQKEIEHWKAGMKIVERDKNNHIERLEKELDNIIEIEKSHKEENGKLRVELEQEKEKNKEIAIKNRALKEESNACGEQIVSLDNQLKAKEQEIAYLKSQIPSDKIFYFSDKDYISKDKIKERLAELENKSGGNSYYVQAMINAEKNILKELLEGK